MTDILPASLARWQNLSFIKRRSTTEYSAECPSCGSSGHVGSPDRDPPDRFRMWDDERARGWCRGCGYFAWADAGEERRPSPVQIREMEERRAELSLQERQRVRQKIVRLQEDAVWEYYHKQLSVEAIAKWEEDGIPLEFQQYYRLGFCPEYPSKEFHSAAQTIPYFNESGMIENLQYRLLSPPDSSDKYRWTYGIPAPIYRTDPDKPVEGRVLVCEGCKKALVLYIRLLQSGLESTWDSVVALPNKYLTNYQKAQLEGAQDITLCLDPDTNFGHVETVAEKLTNRPVKIMTLACKADDFFTTYGGTADQFVKIARLAQPIS